jgi:peptide/nickel transport system permease protein
MLRFIVNRIGSMVVTMLVISILVFFIAEVVPVDPARNALGRYATEESVQELREEMGLDRPAPVRYVSWLTGIFRGDFGMSIHYRRPVADLIGARLKRSLTLAALGFAYMIPVGLFFGAIAGINEGKLIDRILSVMGGIFVSIPAFAGGVFMIVIFTLWLGWRVSTAEEMDSDYVRTAILKGVPKRKVIRRHALRNAMIAPFTAIMLHVNWLIGGVVVVEVLFNYPGLGSLLLDAALRNDIILLEGGTLVMTFVAVATQAVADIGVYFMNPRLRFE